MRRLETDRITFSFSPAETADLPVSVQFRFPFFVVSTFSPTTKPRLCYMNACQNLIKLLTNERIPKPTRSVKAQWDHKEL